MMVVIVIIMMMVIMIVIMMVVVVVVIMVVIVVMVMVMIHVGSHDTRQADRVMWMVVAVSTAIVCRRRSRIERHGAETSCGGNGQAYYGLTEHVEALQDTTLRRRLASDRLGPTCHNRTASPVTPQSSSFLFRNIIVAESQTVR